jgi:hypothetical protein
MVRLDASTAIFLRLEAVGGAARQCRACASFLFSPYLELIVELRVGLGTSDSQFIIALKHSLG